MLYIDDNRLVKSDRIKIKIFNNIEQGRMDTINGIIVRQTDTPEASHVFNSYSHPKSNGAHFLIDRDGTIYQTAPLLKITWHVGKMKSRCLVTKKCEPAELKRMADLEKKLTAKGFSDIEKIKPFPERYPANVDSIGIEIVGKAQKENDQDPVYETVNNQQNSALKWLVSELSETLDISASEVYKHPDVARKNKTEASTASW